MIFDMLDCCGGVASLKEATSHSPAACDCITRTEAAKHQKWQSDSAWGGPASEEKQNLIPDHADA